MKTFRMMKTDVQGQYVTDQVVTTDSGDTVQVVYPDKEPVTVQFSLGTMSCHECPLVTANAASFIVCSSRRRDKGGLIMPMCTGWDGSLYKIARVGDVMEDL